MNAASSVEAVEYAYMSLKIFVINWKIDLEKTDESFFSANCHHLELIRSFSYFYIELTMTRMDSRVHSTIQHKHLSYPLIPSFSHSHYSFQDTLWLKPSPYSLQAQKYNNARIVIIQVFQNFRHHNLKFKCIFAI